MAVSRRPEQSPWARRLAQRRAASSVRHDRWLVSYADFVTLLFAFFTTMYASSTVDVAKLNSVVASMQRVFVASPLADNPARTAVPPDAAFKAEPAKSPARSQSRVDLQKELRDRLSQEVADGRVDLDVDSRGVVISLRESGSFPVGSADLTLEARGLLSTIAGTLTDLTASVRVEGHTDDVPIRTSRFGSNWDLSTARAITVLQYLVTAGGLDAARLSASGYGEFRPRVPNDSLENRAKNRRVDLVVLSDTTRAAEEPSSSSTSPVEASRDSGR